jgi:hypothetical protein
METKYGQWGSFANELNGSRTIESNGLTLSSDQNDGNLGSVSVVRHLRVVGINRIEARLVFQAEYENYGIHPSRELAKIAFINCCAFSSHIYCLSLKTSNCRTLRQTRSRTAVSAASTHPHTHSPAFRERLLRPVSAVNNFDCQFEFPS